jgi:hypothetical protein
MRNRIRIRNANFEIRKLKGVIWNNGLLEW